MAPKIAQPSRSRKWVGIIGGILISAMVVGGGVYIYQKKRGDDTQKNLQAEVNSLTAELAKTKVTSTTGWKTYSNSKIGYSFKYPSSLTVMTDGTAFWKQANYSSTILVSIFKIDKYGDPIGLGPDYDQIANKADITTALNDGSKLKIPGLNAAKITIGKYGDTTFQRIFPGSAEGCSCYSLNYTAVVGDYFFQLSRYVPTKDVTDFDSRFKADREVLINNLYGDMEGVVKTFKVTVASVATPTPKATSTPATLEQMTFTSKTGWSIQYPSDYSVSSCHACTITDDGAFVTFFPLAASSSNNYLELMVTPTTPAANVSVQDSFIAYENSHKANGFQLVSKKELTVSGFSAIDFVYKLTNASSVTPNQDQQEKMYIKTPNTTYDISLFPVNIGLPGHNLAISDFVNYSALKTILSTLVITK